jgi:hypothetical protein
VKETGKMRDRPHENVQCDLRFRCGVRTKLKKNERRSEFTRENQTNPRACIKLFPLKMTMRLFNVTRMPIDSIVCFVKAHLNLDTCIIGAI